MKRFGGFWQVGFGAVAAVALVVTPFGAASAQEEVQHGIAFTKGCTSPVAVGSPYSCSFTVLNLVDDAHDTLTFNSLIDTVHAASGDQTTPNIISTAKLDRGVTSATCTGGGITGTGTVADPWIGATSCTLPFGSLIHVQSSSHYTVQAGDFNLTNHVLRDDATLGWNDLCDDPANTGNSNCNPNPPPDGAAGQALVVRNPSQTATTIRNANGGAVTTVEVGTTVHDFVHVTNNSQNGALPPPSGNVTIDWFLNGTCDGSPAANSGPIGPLVNGDLDATGFAFTPPAGHFAFLAHYLGDGVYAPSNGPCEPLTVVDANIQITPSDATNPVGTDHVLTGHVNVNDGNGFANAPAGTLITFTIQSGPGAFDGPSTCLTILATGSCTVQIKSTTTGTTVVRATTTVTVGGIALTRTTGDGKAGDSADANKHWVATTITTALNPGATAQEGTSVTDQATLHGATAGATGTVSYAVYSDDTCQTLVKSLGTKTVSNGAVGPSDAWVATVGDFWFQAVYSGDPAHTGATSDCTTEPIHVTSSPPVTQESPGTSTTVAATAELPRTGSGPVGAQILFALGIVGLGGFLLTASRRRQRQAR